MTDALNKLIGKGIKFPFLPTELKNLQMTEGTERINQSLLMLFETPKGSRLFLPEYGTNLRVYKFEPNDEILLEELRQVLILDIQKWEPRITVTDLVFYRDPDDIDNHILYIHLQYRILNSDTLNNFVYPYKMEPYDSVENDTL